MPDSAATSWSRSRSDSVEKIVVAGAGLAGLRTCQQLRQRGFAGQITLIGAEDDAPYDRPPLTKAVLLGNQDDTTLRVDLEELGVTTAFGTAATGLDIHDRVLHTTAGEFGYDGLVIATGALPRQLPGSRGAHLVRTRAQALELRHILTQGGHLAIVGAGWIGAEVATAALVHGCRVTCIEAAASPYSAALGPVGSLLTPWWRDVDLHLNTPVDRVEQHGVHLTDGRVITADAVLVGIGARPDVDWLQDSGLPIERGVVVNERLQAQSGVVAVGDAAAWWSRRFDRRMVVEHWDNAATGPAVAAASVLAFETSDGPVYDPVPYFWSDQFGHKIQYLGSHGRTDRYIIRTNPQGALQHALWFDELDRVSGVLIVDRPRDLLAARKLVESGAQPAHDLAGDPLIPLGELV